MQTQHFNSITFESYIKELEKTVTLENTSIQCISTSHQFLANNVVLTCRAAISTDTLSMEKFKREQIASNKTMEHQWRFQQTTKAPERKKRTNTQVNSLMWPLQHAQHIAHANSEERRSILDALERTVMYSINTVLYVDNNGHHHSRTIRRHRDNHGD